MQNVLFPPDAEPNQRVFETTCIIPLRKMYLSGGLDALAEAEEDDDPGEQEAERELPSDLPRPARRAVGLVEHDPPATNKPQLLQVEKVISDIYSITMKASACCGVLVEI